MFCPKCKREYSDGFYRCADCGADLVAEQSPEVMEEVSYVDLVEVFSTYRQNDVAFVKSVLDGEGIRYFFEGDSTIMLVGTGAYARLLVMPEDVERVREILRELELD
jgi:hypothetical protein